MIGDLVHGGSLDWMRTAFPDAPGPWIDLSTGINPWPYPVTPFRTGALERLPTQADYERCRVAMATSIGAPVDSLTLAPGSELLIRLLPRIISPKRVAVLRPGYGDHAQAWHAAGCDVIETSDPLAHINQVDAIVVCNPNNPDGRVFDPHELNFARSELAKHGGWLIVDEAYADLIPQQSLAKHAGADGLIMLHSFGKFYGLAGVRLGAITAPVRVRRGMNELLGTWPVSGMALELGAHAFGDTVWQTEMRHTLEDARKSLDKILLSGGFQNIQGTDLFRLVECDDAHGRWRELAEAGIYVRRFSCSGRHLRFGLPRTEADADRLRIALTL
jgi:cobalamin biosynthesis protein CobC